VIARKFNSSPSAHQLDDAPVAVVIERARAAEPIRPGASLDAETDRSDADLERWRAELLDPAGWGEILLRYGRATRLAVALTGVDGNLLGPCHNPQPVWNLVRRSASVSVPEPAPACPFCLVPDPPCDALAAAWVSGAAAFVNDPAGLAHMAIPLFLGRQRLGVLVAGQTFAQYPQRWALRSLARQMGVCQNDIWHAAMHQVPISRATLRRYADLLASLGEAFLRQRYAAILDRNLHETSQRYRFMIDGSKDHALFTVNAAGCITSWNPGAAHLLGYAESEILGRHYSCLFTPEDVAAQTHQNQIRLLDIRELDNAGRIQRESWWLRRDGTRFLSETVTARLGESGVPEYGILLRDVTEARHTAEAALQAQKLESIGVLAGGIAHDFNNLLTGILGNVSLALDGLPASHVLRPLLDIAEKSSQKGAALIAQLLSYVGKGGILVSRFDLSALIAEILPMIQTSIPKKVRLTLALNSGVTWIEADSSAVQQIVMNLIINGAEAIGPEGGSVIVSTGMTCLNPNSGQPVAPSEPNAVFIEVRDSGCGMDEATKSRIFDPFFTTKFTGRGLGLAAVSGIVRDLKGKLDVYTAPGEGSTFRVVFPAVPPPQTAAPAPPPVVSPGAGVILLADDDPQIRNLARAMLERDGYSVLLAANGQEAVDLFRRHQGTIGAVLMDLTMPVMSGVEALRLITQIRPDVPVVISSGYGETAIRQEFNGAQVWVVRKPYTLSELREKIAAALATRT